MATSPVWRRNRFLELDRLLQTYPGLRLLPVTTDSVKIAGTLTFSAPTARFEAIHESFDITISVPAEFPAQLPTVRETAGRIPKSFHTNPDGTLCLGSPTRQRLCLVERPSVLTFVELCVIPFFYNFGYLQKYGVLPLGELPHGWKGIRQDYAQLFDVKTEAAAVGLVKLASIKKRIANKYPCPCGSGRRLGKCHNRKVNGYRDKLGRRWFLKEYSDLAG